MAKRKMPASFIANMGKKKKKGKGKKKVLPAFLRNKK